jgi:Icc-related predicted phosphoesterase
MTQNITDIAALHTQLSSMGFSKQVIDDVIDSLADLYIASYYEWKIPYLSTGKGPSSYSQKLTQYWPYDQVVTNILLQYNFIDGSSRHSVYGRYGTNWHFYALTNNAFNIAQEAYMDRFNANLQYIQNLLYANKDLLPIIYYASSQSDLYANYCFFCTPSNTIFDSIITLKVSPSSSTQKLEEIRKTLNARSPRTFDILYSAFRSISTTNIVTNKINQFFNPLYNNRKIVHYLPDVSWTGGIYDHVWVITEELRTEIDKVINNLGGIDQNKLIDFIYDFIALLLVHLTSKGYNTISIIDQIIDTIINDNQNLNLNKDKIINRFQTLINTISNSTACISKFNSQGGPNDPPFIIFDKNKLNDEIKNYLQSLSNSGLSLI